MIDKTKYHDMFSAFWNYASTALYYLLQPCNQIVVIQFYYTFCRIPSMKYKL